jgi:hypothetical protein
VISFSPDFVDARTVASYTKRTAKGFGIMIAKIALFLVFAALTVSAQTNFDVLVCKDASYTNATIIRATPAYLVVSHNDGISKVALTNLPDSLQQKYPYDPEKIAAAAAAVNAAVLEDSAKANAQAM